MALQALLRNALAEPYVLGVAGGAALGGTLVILAATAAQANFTSRFNNVFGVELP